MMTKIRLALAVPVALLAVGLMGLAIVGLTVAYWIAGTRAGFTMAVDTVMDAIEYAKDKAKARG